MPSSNIPWIAVQSGVLEPANAFGKGIHDSHSCARFHEQASQVTAVTCQRKDARGGHRKTAIDQVLDEPLGMGPDRCRRQRGCRIGLIGFRWAEVRELSQPAHVAHSKPQGEALGSCLAGPWKRAAGRLVPKIDHDRQFAIARATARHPGGLARESATDARLVGATFVFFGQYRQWRRLHDGGRLEKGFKTELLRRRTDVNSCQLR